MKIFDFFVPCPNTTSELLNAFKPERSTKIELVDIVCIRLFMDVISRGLNVGDNNPCIRIGYDGKHTLVCDFKIPGVLAVEDCCLRVEIPNHRDHVRSRLRKLDWCEINESNVSMYSEFFDRMLADRTMDMKLDFLSGIDLRESKGASELMSGAESVDGEWVGVHSAVGSITREARGKLEMEVAVFAPAFRGVNRSGVFTFEYELFSDEVTDALFDTKLYPNTLFTVDKKAVDNFMDVVGM